jgi:hypothetical protein
MSGYLIYAKLQQGRPVLQVVDAETHRVYLNWDCPSVHDAGAAEVQGLFRQLMLLSCRQSLLQGTS